MSKYTEEERLQWAEYFQTSWRAEFRPVGMTKRKTKAALKKVWDDDYFWYNVGPRYGLRPLDKKILDIHSLEAATSNFWAMLRERTLETPST